MSQTKTMVMVFSSNVSDTNKEHDILLEYLRQKQGLCNTPRISQQKQVLWYTTRMSQTKTRGMVYYSNVSDKNKVYDILRECFRQRQGLWYTPRMSDKKKGYDILLEFLRQKQGLWYTPRMYQTKTNGMIYSSMF